VSPSVATLEGVGAHLAIASLAHEVPAEGRVFCHRYRLGGWRQERSGLANLALGRLELESFPTSERLEALACVLHFGASDFRCGLVQWPGPERAAEVERALFDDLDRMSLAQLLRAVDRVFAGRDYTLRDLFLDERRQVADLLLQDTMRRYEDDYLDIFQDNQRLMGFLREIDSPIPGPLRAAADVSLTRRLLEVTGRAVRGQVDLASAEQEIGEAVELARRLGAHLHVAALRRDVEQLVRERVAAIVAGRAVRNRTEELVGVVDLARKMGLELDLWEAQNEVWAWARSPRMSLDRESLQALARTLWLDEASLERRAGLAPPPA
jgi:hypothetical protein